MIMSWVLTETFRKKLDRKSIDFSRDDGFGAKLKTGPTDPKMGSMCSQWTVGIGKVLGFGLRPLLQPKKRKNKKIRFYFTEKHEKTVFCCFCRWITFLPDMLFQNKKLWRLSFFLNSRRTKKFWNRAWFEKVIKPQSCAVRCAVLCRLPLATTS